MALTVLHDVLETAVSANASDVHIKTGAAVAYRVDGEMVVSDFIAEANLLDEFIRQVSTEEQQKNFKVDGDLDLSHKEDNVGRFRVNIHRQRNMVAINFRWVKSKIMTIDQLGLPEVLKQIAETPRGIIILTGTTGSGKSTTLAAMLEHINHLMHKHIITIEDP
ncbi:MAG: Flp pilus assembly complex ATPase component TadA, partial [Lentisphaeria bacterium]|nr:Flp pilus assembly complex ATPase component TadA [Lentisphaeria bacterium]